MRKSPPENILVIRTHRLGDILQLTPMLGGLRQSYPGSRIYFATGQDYAPLLQGNPCIDSIIPIPEREYRNLLKNEPDRKPALFNELYDLASELRRIHFDLVINRQYEWGAVFASLLDAGEVLGGAYSPEKGFHFEDAPSAELFATIRNRRGANRTNLADWACRIAAVPPGGRRSHFPLWPQSLARADELLGPRNSSGAREGREAPIAIHMGAAKAFRQWGEENFMRLVSWLVAEKKRRVVLTGTPDERPLASRVLKGLRTGPPEIVDLVGATTLLEMGAVLHRCALLVSGDTGPAHIAAAVGTPVIALFFGTAYPWETAPYGPGHMIIYSDPPCAPCSHPDRCERHVCRERITPERVMEALETLDAVHSPEPTSRGGVTETSAGGTRLFATALNEAGEQILIDPISRPEPFRPPAGTGTPIPFPMLSWHQFLVQKSKEFEAAFHDGREGEAFALFSAYLGGLEYLKKDLAGSPEFQRTFTGWLGACSEAVDRKDLVTLRDIIEYGINPFCTAFAETGRVS